MASIIQNCWFWREDTALIYHIFGSFAMKYGHVDSFVTIVPDMNSMVGLEIALVE